MRCVSFVFWVLLKCLDSIICCLGTILCPISSYIGNISWTSLCLWSVWGNFNIYLIIKVGAFSCSEIPTSSAINMRKCCISWAKSRAVPPPWPCKSSRVLSVNWTCAVEWERKGKGGRWGVGRRLEKPLIHVWY